MYALPAALLSALCESDLWALNPADSDQQLLTNLTASYDLFMLQSEAFAEPNERKTINSPFHSFDRNLRWNPKLWSRSILKLLNVLNADCLITMISASCSQLEYSYVPLLYGMVLEVTVKSKKTFVAATNIRLEKELLGKEMWFPLGNSAIWPQSPALYACCQ